MTLHKLIKNNGNFVLIESLKQWGVTFFVGVTGGNLMHVTKYLAPFQSLEQVNESVPRMLTMSEYVAGYVPVGYYLASGKIAACVATTGVAVKLASCGITDAKLHNIPAVYIFALNPTYAFSKSPLQDMSVHGINIIMQLKAELGDACIIIDDIRQLKQKLIQIQNILLDSRPVVIAFHPDILSKSTSIKIPKIKKKKNYFKKDVDFFLKKIAISAPNKRIIIYASSEASRIDNIQELINQLCDILQAPVIYSVNGAAAISSSNRYNYGYISFGGNEKSIALLNDINQNDIVIALGFDPGEYSLTLKKIAANEIWHFTELSKQYGSVDGTFKHRAIGKYYQVRGNIGLSLKAILPRLKKINLLPRPEILLDENLNTRVLSHKVKSDCVDFIAFYELLYQLWQPNSIGFDDVCQSYKDRQYITQRPHPFIKFYTTHDASAMGGAFGLGVGAKIAMPSLTTFIFSGDGCWRLFGGAIADAAKLNLRLFIINNGMYGLIEQSYEKVIPDFDKSHYHAILPPINFIMAAKSMGWEAFRVNADLSNLKEIMRCCYTYKKQSILIDVPVDAHQFIGFNSRIDNLKLK